MVQRALSPDDEAGRGIRAGAKQPGAFRTISEVAEDLDVPQHVLRFWETRFPQIKPLKRGGGRRYYRPEDVALLRGIRHLLYSDGYTIKGVQKVLRENGAHAVIAVAKPLAERLADHRAQAPVVGLPPLDFEAEPDPAPAPEPAQLESSPEEERSDGERDAAYWRGLVIDLRRELAEIRSLLAMKSKA
ncbi:MerR family transcriptional regulator [Zavarzinia compransoris]|uniref:MerR family transcriptional regulator n=1 Tax=Zavarzinia compransoris TaxID=1264899 RepID=A0A317EBR1_9PROT|nr:MerR family transcriptional regulator [Zavarzinia compransoris]PWR23724.1 MerR family transcriptional regulator [Zavarzinia compransoris]TDP47949.1 DNA-binding transcriptional MerR regulator [Zavarzinia compransoris]